MKLERTAIGVMGLSAAAIDDVIGWILLGVATLLMTTKFNGWHLLLQLAGIAIFFIFLQKVIGPWLRSLWRRKVAKSNDDSLSGSFLVLLIIGLFLSSLATHELGIFVIFGAFLFGTSLHQEASLVKAWRDRFSDVVLVAFVPVFFTNTGLNTRIGSLQTSEAWFACGLVMIAAVIGKLGGCYLGARVTGQPPREAGCIAALMNTRALMALIAINIGRELGLLTPPLFTMLVIMALLTTAMCGPLLRLWLPSELCEPSRKGVKPLLAAQS
jgi:Kef-type K+ transport system membrane component KefB